MKLKRKLDSGESGADVKMVQRALNRASRRANPSNPTTIALSGRYDAATQRRVSSFRHARGLPTSHVFDQATLDQLASSFDAYGRMRYASYRVPPVKTPMDIAFDAILKAMRELDANSRGYVLGAGHGVPLDTIRATDYFDCSSSTSYVLWRGGVYEHDYAQVSERFETWGAPGVGKRLTIYANHEHVWVRLHKTRWWRFDTSPHKDGRPSENPRRGPRLRYFPRFTSSFVVRHYPGL